MPRNTRRTASRSACRRAALDFSYGDAFPHETDMDQLGGVDFTKGCYVGQDAAKAAGAHTPLGADAAKIYGVFVEAGEGPRDFPA